MATANDIIIRGFTRAGIRSAESALEDEEIADGLSLLNEVLSLWEPLYNLGFSPIKDVSDPVRIPRYAEKAVIDALALELLPEYSRVAPPMLLAAAARSLNMMLSINVNIGDVDMPSTLPRGSGNECDYYDDRFFHEKDKLNF